MTHIIKNPETGLYFTMETSDGTTNNKNKAKTFFDNETAHNWLNTHYLWFKTLAAQGFKVFTRKTQE